MDRGEDFDPEGSQLLISLGSGPFRSTLARKEQLENGLLRVMQRKALVEIPDCLNGSSFCSGMFSRNLTRTSMP